MWTLRSKNDINFFDDKNRDEDGRKWGLSKIWNILFFAIQSDIMEVKGAGESESGTPYWLQI